MSHEHKNERLRLRVARTRLQLQLLQDALRVVVGALSLDLRAMRAAALGCAIVSVLIVSNAAQSLSAGSPPDSS